MAQTNAPVFDELLTPKQVCQLLQISRRSFERMKTNNFIKTYQPFGTKVWVRKSELMEHFSKDLAQAAKAAQIPNV